MRKGMLLLALVAGLLIFTGATALAQTADDPPVWVYGTNCNPNTTNCFLFGGEVNGVTTNTLIMNAHGGASQNITGTLLLILGIPTGGGSAPTPNAPLLEGNGGVPLYGWNGNFSGGTFTSGLPFGTSSLDVCTFLGLSPVAGCNSESLGNWQNASKAVLGTTPSGFSIYVYEIKNVDIPGQGGTITVSFSTDIPTGTFLSGYGCASTKTVGGELFCSSVGDTYITPFTNSGLEDRVPEPGTLALFGSGLFAVAGLIRRRRAG